MDKVVRMTRAIVTVTAMVLGAVAALSMMVGCAVQGPTPNVACYEIVSISKELRALLVFNQCSGDLELRPFAPLGERAPAEPEPEEDTPTAPVDPKAPSKWSY